MQTMMMNLKDNYKQNMICNAQLDNEKQALQYYVEDIKVSEFFSSMKP